MRLPADLKAEIARCTRCGKCRSVCPVFGQTLDEATVARGRIRLLEEASAGRMPMSRRFELYISTCLRCERCSSVCPAEVRFDDLMTAAREQIYGTWWGYRLGRLGMALVARRRWLFDLVMGQVRRGQWLLGEEGGDGGVAARHLPLLFLTAPGSRRLANVVPPLASRSALRRWGGEVLAGRPRIALFIGCLMNYVYPEIVAAVLEFCRRQGLGVVVPRGQVCCGSPALSLGAGDLARSLARRNSEVFRACGVNTVVTACASCGWTLKEAWPRLAGRGWRGVRVLDFSELAAEAPVPGAVREGERVAYHDPCRLKFGQGISAEPRAALSRAVELVEMPGADLCCGSGGLFAAFHPDLAGRISDAKADAIAACDAPTVATACPACIMRIRMALAERGVERRVVHLANVITGVGSGG